ncbi:MAG: DNA cytosine methyltransferase [Treponema sp.]|nr:DNA cytosine methyltransferase [Treponema sp.]
MTSLYKTIDLFSGAGGLSRGFKNTKCFEIIAAFEKNENAKQTYKKNFNIYPNSDVCTADYKALLKEYGNVDVVIGGPPCQGFSNANRQHNTTINQNNMLVKEYIRAILELQPKAFVMENVGMLKSDVHKFYVSIGDIEKLINKYHIQTKEEKIFLLKSEYKFAGISELLGNIDNLNNHIWDEEIYQSINVIYKQRNNNKKFHNALKKYQKGLESFLNIQNSKKNTITFNINQKLANSIKDYFNDKRKTTTLVASIERPLMIQKMIKSVKEILENNIIVKEYCTENDVYAIVDSFPVYEYLTKILNSSEQNYAIATGILNAADFGVPQKRKRYVIMGIKKEISSSISLPKRNQEKYNTVEDAIKDIEDAETTTDAKNTAGFKLPTTQKITTLAKKLRDSNKLFNNLITSTKETAMERFRLLKQGENFHSLDLAHKKNSYTNSERTQNTIYLRLKYKEPSGTVVNVRKSMWIHPTKDRSLSVREAARLQTFPDSFIFCGSKDSQYQQVGNAVPPMLAEAIARKLLEYLH